MNKKFWTWNVACDEIIFFMTLTALIMIFTSKEAAMLASSGWVFLKYFTVLSNIFVGLCSAISFIHLFIKIDAYPKWLSTLKMVSTTGVFVTFLTVAVYLGPLYGYLEMLKGAKLLLHLLIPVAAIIEFIILIPNKENKFLTTVFGIVPVFLYGIFYLTNIAVNNGYGNVNYDWYQFGYFGLGIGILMFIIMLAISFGLTVALYYLNRLIKINRTK